MKPKPVLIKVPEDLIHRLEEHIENDRKLELTLLGDSNKIKSLMAFLSVFIVGGIINIIICLCCLSILKINQRNVELIYEAVNPQMSAYIQVYKEKLDEETSTTFK